MQNTTKKQNSSLVQNSSPAPLNYTPAPKLSYADYSKKTQSSPVTPAMYLANNKPVPKNLPYNVATVPKTSSEVNSTIAKAFTESNPVYDPSKNMSLVSDQEGYTPAPLNYSPVSYGGSSEVPTLSGSESDDLSNKSGLKGIGNKGQFSGMTMDQANARASEIKTDLQRNVSSNTSFSYNSNFLNGKTSMKKVFDDYGIGMKDSFSDPWKTNEDKKNSANKLLEGTTSKLSGMFKSGAEFDSTYLNNPEFKNLVDGYTKQGLTIDAIKSKIKNVDYTQNQFNSGNPLIDKILSPQTNAAKQNIDYLKTVPEQYKNLYFGDEGYFTNIRKEAESSLISLNESYAKVAKNTIDDLDLQAQKNEQEAKIQLATVEESRSTNKNYLTGMLAKLGALTTSGEAPAAISRLDAKYDQIKTQTESSLKTAQSNIAQEKASQIASLENNRLSKVSAIRQDLNKSSFEITKDLMTLENNTRKEIGSIISDWQKQASAINKSFVDKATNQKDKYNDLYFKIASNGLSNKMMTDLKQNQPLTPAEASTYGVPYGTTYGQIQGKTLTNEGKPVTETQAKDSGFAQRMIDVENVIQQPDISKAMTSINPEMFARLNFVESPSEGYLGTLSKAAARQTISPKLLQMYQAQRNFINATLRKESGAAIAYSEFDNASKQYFVQPGDSTDIVAQKKQNRERKIQEMMLGAGKAYDKFQNIKVPASAPLANNNSFWNF